MQDAARPWSVPVTAEEIPEAGLHKIIEAPADVRANIARVAGLRELSRLSAEFDLLRRGAGIGVSGHVRARVGQTCVVTLDPIENDIEEPIDLVFAPAAAVEAVRAEDAGEPPETLVEGRVDLGALATEFLLLAINPYPRKPGAEFAAPDIPDAGDRPFAALEALKKRLGGAS